MIRRLNVLIVPDEGGPARRLNVPTYLVKGAAWLILFVVIGLMIALFSYAKFIRKALDFDTLAAENIRLQDENRRILLAAREVDESRQALVGILKKIQAGDGAIHSDSEFGSVSQVAAGALLSGVRSGREGALAGLPTVTPIKGFVSQGYNEDPLFPERSHRGIDIAGKLSAPVVAAASGTVVFNNWTPHFGNCLIVVHEGGYQTFYGHNSVNLKSVGDAVKRGEPVALLGTSGRSSAPHVHFEIWKDGASIDPSKLLHIK